MFFYKIFTKITYVFFKIFFKIEITGLENIPPQGRIVICSNHVGLTDPVLLAAVIPRELNYMAKKELFENKLLGFAITRLGAFPVDRDTTGLSAIKTAIKLLKQDKVFAIFPQGTRSSEENSIGAKPGIAMIAIKGKSPIIPIHIDTQYEFFEEIKVNIGTPINLEEYFDKKISTEKYEELSNGVLKEIYKLNSV